MSHHVSLDVQINRGSGKVNNLWYAAQGYPSVKTRQFLAGNGFNSFY